MDNDSSCMVGLVENKIKTSSFDTVFDNKKELGPNLIKLAEVLGK